MDQQVNIFWFRRDLRLEDNAGLYRALKAGLPVIPVFIFDTTILDELEDRSDARVGFIHQSIMQLDKDIRKHKGNLQVYLGKPREIFKKLLETYSIHTIFTNRDYEPYARERDEAVSALAKKQGTNFRSFKDQVIFDTDEVIKDNGEPYTVFTPYSKKWKASLTDFHLKAYPVRRYTDHFYKGKAHAIPDLEEIGFTPSSIPIPPHKIPEDIIADYAATRDIPGIKGTSHLGLHLRFGTISIRQLATVAGRLSQTFLGELIWRDFYQAILWHFPQVGKGHAFKPAYDHIKWRDSEADFEKWKNGETGFPIVDAGMRELNNTGFMHNRVRMITASFLSKHLLINWRLGEAYFAEKLLDYDLAANNGGWQWAAGSGCDAAPYFRIFNPWLQEKKFDPKQVYIKKWIPEFDTPAYPAPMVDHAFARDRCLKVYSEALKRS